MATLSAIHVFPLKSGAPLMLTEASVQTRGLADDRRWMVIDATGKFVTGRELARLTLIRATPHGSGVNLTAPGMPALRITAPTQGVRGQQGSEQHAARCDDDCRPQEHTNHTCHNALI